MRIRVMADLHVLVNERQKPAHPFYEKFLQHFFQEGTEADLYVCLGDLTQTGTEAEYAEAFKLVESFGRASSFVHIPGNHDLLSADVAQTERWLSTPPVVDGYGLIEADAATLLFVNTSQVMNKPDWGGRLNGKQLERLEQRLSEDRGKPKLIFAHHPLPHTTALSERHKMRIDEEGPLLETISKAAGVCLWLNGHNHVQSIEQNKNWTYIQTASAVCLPSYRDIVITDTSIQVQTKRISDSETMEAARQTMALYGGFHRVDAETAAGAAKDGSVEICIAKK